MSTVLIIVVVLPTIAIAAALIAASAKPDTFRVQRSAVIAASPERIFPLIADFHQWAGWSPWEHRDPAMKRIFEGPQSGVGAIYAWNGNRNVGAGRMEIIEATPSRIVIKLDFIKPFAGHNIAEFALRPNGPSTEIVWTMHGPAPFLSKLMQLVMNMDRMIGKDFEAGLAGLKRLAET
ncbi:SRPBCC family protein [Bradyrhizobium sp. STM 3557]|uniref:SRPBCC family protein n=1 Tax=Bradyrhizobium sp. STM 3557 TaxID=578920 RepID=UPI00388F1156